MGIDDLPRHLISGAYRIAKPLLFRWDPESAHEASVKLLSSSATSRIARSLGSGADARLAVNAFGIEFPGPVLLAAGFDKNAVAVLAMAALGFDGVEIGTVTPLPQSGNPKPRIWRLPEYEALINRMGFPNQGLEEVAKNLQTVRRPGQIIGCNIGPNRASVEAGTSAQDCITCLRSLHQLGAYFVINISSPNTAGLRDLQGKSNLRQFFSNIIDALSDLERKPILLKISPDLSDSEIADIVEVAFDFRLSGIVATNTTVARPIEMDAVSRNLEGGLSGRPLAPITLNTIKAVNRHAEGRLPIVAVGGIFTGADAIAGIEAGASLVQIYTAFVYRGPNAATLIKREMIAELDRRGIRNLTELIDNRSLRRD